jgi:hypothetical protein
VTHALDLAPAQWAAGWGIEKAFGVVKLLLARREGELPSTVATVNQFVLVTHGIS